ncbi:MAG: nickel-binding protein [Dehalococcoidia bacterium]
MPNFVVDQTVGASTLDEVIGFQQRAEQEPRGLLAGYWTPDDGRLLSVFESPEDGEPPEVAEGARVLPVLPITADEYGPRDLQSQAANEDDLSLVLVRRQLDPLTDREFRAIALQAIMCAYEYSDMRWLRSYWSRSTDQLFCLFETSCHERVSEHARRSRIPCDEIHDAIEIRAGAPDALTRD